MPDDLLGYVLRIDDDADRERIEMELDGDASKRMELEEMKASLRPLELLRDDSDPPPGLADRTVARLFVRGRIVSPPVSRGDFADGSSGGIFRTRWDLAIALTIFVIVSGLGLSYLGKLNRDQTIQICQNNMMLMHQALENYAAAHNGAYPNNSTNDRNVSAGSFIVALAKAGCLPKPAIATCPGVQLPDRNLMLQLDQLDYAYTLGYRDGAGQVQGLRRGDDRHDAYTPVLADRPLRGWVPRPSIGNHMGGANVLFFGGAVKFCVNPNVGHNSDNIFQNESGRIAAGLHPHDAVLGEKDDRP